MRTVVLAGILKVQLEGCNGPEAADGIDGSEAHESQHGEATIPQLLLRGVVVGEAERVEGERVEEATLYQTVVPWGAEHMYSQCGITRLWMQL